MERRVRTLAAALLALVALAGVGLAITGGVGVSGTVTIDAPSGPSVDVVTNGGELLLDGPAGPNTVEVTHDNGEVVFESSGSTQATVDTTEIVGSYTSVSGIDASNDLTITPEDKPGVTVGGGIDSVEFSSMTVDDGTRDFSYSASSSASVTVNDIGATTETVIAVAGDGTVLDQTTADSSGTATFSTLNSGSYDVQIATTSDPALSGATPRGGDTVSETPVELSIDVNDADFATSQGDSVNVTFEAQDPSQSSFQTVDSKTLTANGTANVSYSPATLGVQEWRAVATDEFGNEVTSDTFTFETPNSITVRNETSPDQVIDSGVQTTFTFFGDDEQFQRTSTDGTIDMSGLPDEDFILEVTADGDYVSRTVYIQSIYQQQDVYLLPENTTSTQTRFVLDDPTGNFGPETVLFVEKPIQVDNQTVYRTITADEFGVEGLTATLESDERYRLRVRSEDGVTQIIGPYRTAVSNSETVTVSPGQPGIEIGDSEKTWATNAELTNRTLEYRYDDPEQLTSSLDVTIYERGNESNVLQTESFADLGSVSQQIDLSENQSQTSWVVEYDVTRDGKSFTTTELATSRAEIVPDIDTQWKRILAIGFLFLSAGMFSVLNASVGGIVVSLQGGILWWTGWLEGATAGAAVVIALFISILVGLWSSSRP